MPRWIVGNFYFFYFFILTLSLPIRHHTMFQEISSLFDVTCRVIWCHMQDYLMPHAFLLKFRYSVPSHGRNITPDKHFWHAKPFGTGGSLQKNLNLQYTLVGRKRVKIDQDFSIRERGKLDQFFFFFFFFLHLLFSAGILLWAWCKGFWIVFSLNFIWAKRNQCSLFSTVVCKYVCMFESSDFTLHGWSSVSCGVAAGGYPWQMYKWQMYKSILNFGYGLGEGWLVFLYFFYYYYY